MGMIELTLIAIGLSMDAFAVSICKGLGMTRLNYKNASIIALFFGGFQALMPLIGWFLGSRFQVYISSFDHLIAFVLLAFIGGKMIIESHKKQDEACRNCDVLNLRELLVLAVATSIDALAVGITLAIMPNTNIWTSILLIGIITFVLSVVGVMAGHKFGSKWGKKAEFAGGLILVFIGCKILVEHMGWLHL